MKRKTQFKIAYRCTSMRLVQRNTDGKRLTELVSDAAASGSGHPRLPPRVCGPAACSHCLATQPPPYKGKLWGGPEDSPMYSASSSNLDWSPIFA